MKTSQILARFVDDVNDEMRHHKVIADAKAQRGWEACSGTYEKVMSRQLATLMSALDFDGLMTHTAFISMPKEPKEGDTVTILGHNFEYKPFKPAVVEDLSKEVEGLTTFDKTLIVFFLGFWLTGVVAFVRFLIDHLFIFAL